MERTFLFCRWWIGESTDGVIYTESSLSMRIPGQSSWNYVSITDLEKRDYRAQEGKGVRFTQ